MNAKSLKNFEGRYHGITINQVLYLHCQKVGFCSKVFWVMLFSSVMKKRTCSWKCTHFSRSVWYLRSENNLKQFSSFLLFSAHLNGGGKSWSVTRFCFYKFCQNTTLSPLHRVKCFSLIAFPASRLWVRTRAGAWIFFVFSSQYFVGSILPFVILFLQ